MRAFTDPCCSHGRSLGYVLADAGFDVWLGNVRGNRYGKSHSALSAKSEKFWRWSWDEMASFDVPALVDYVVSKAAVPQISYVGHGQGATIGLVAFSKDSELASKIRCFVALAPVVSLKESTSLLVRAFKTYRSEKQWTDVVGSSEVLTKTGTRYFTAVCLLLPTMCKQVTLLHLQPPADSR